MKKMWGTGLKTPWEATEGLGSFENSPKLIILALSAPVAAKRTKGSAPWLPLRFKIQNSKILPGRVARGRALSA